MTFAASISLPRQTCDLLKIVAALLVITAHMASTALGAKYGSDHVAFYAIASQNGYIGVAVFFFLSGFGLMESEQKAHLDLKSFVRRRLMKIYLPVVLVSCLWLSLQYALPSVAEHQKWGGVFHWRTALYEILWNFSDPVMWYIRVLIFLYIAFFVCSVVALRLGVKNTFMIFLGLSICYAMNDTILGGGIQKHSVPMFAIGAMTSLIKSDRHAILKFGLMTVISGFAVSASAFITNHPLTGFAHCFFDYLMVLFLVIAISCKPIRWKVPVLLSAITFDLYLVHFKVLIVESEIMSLTVFLTLSIPISIAISYLFMRFRSLLLNPFIAK